MILTAEELAQIEAQAAAEYPSECCGFVLVRTSAAPGRLLFPCRNVQDELHAKDPLGHPRDARTAYHIHPHDLKTATDDLEREGYRIAVVYHSHIDVGAYFSATDKRQALMNGEPAYPGVTYVVLSVVEGKVVEAAGFRWDAALRDFVRTGFERPV